MYVRKMYPSYYKTVEINGKHYCVVGQDTESKDDVGFIYFDSGVSVEAVHVDDCHPCL